MEPVENNGEEKFTKYDLLLFFVILPIVLIAKILELILYLFRYLESKIWDRHIYRKGGIFMKTLSENAIARYRSHLRFMEDYKEDGKYYLQSLSRGRSCHPIYDHRRYYKYNDYTLLLEDEKKFKRLRFVHSLIIWLIIALVVVIIVMA